jgi:hypothetical protein
MYPIEQTANKIAANDADYGEYCADQQIAFHRNVDSKQRENEYLRDQRNTITNRYIYKRLNE